MGKISKGITCSVKECSNQAVRSLPPDAAELLGKNGVEVDTSERRVYLCDEHYKMYKKLKRKEAKLEKWRRSI